jgi:hypothetical protein
MAAEDRHCLILSNLTGMFRPLLEISHILLNSINNPQGALFVEECPHTVHSTRHSTGHVTAQDTGHSTAHKVPVEGVAGGEVILKGIGRSNGRIRPGGLWPPAIRGLW